MRRLLAVSLAILGPAGAAIADDDADALSKQLANPVASLISVPFQNNMDWGGGPNGDGFAYLLNIQPVIPISISEDWNLISRTILPVAYRDYLPESDDFGLGDTTQSLFFSPKAPTAGGLIWGVGPVFLIPTATNDYLGTGKLGVGPTGVALIQKEQWTVGLLANHIWSVAGPSSREDVSSTFMQPFVTYSFGKGFSVTLDTESTYDWVNEEWTVPFNLTAQQVLKLGKQPISVQFGGRYYADAPEGGPDWGLRASLVFLFPKK
jgi:hypothetical protein